MVEGGYRRIERLGDPAHRLGADRSAQDCQQRLAHFASGQPKHEAGQDHAVDLGRAPGVGAQHLDRREASRARDAKLDVAQRRQQMAPIMAIAPVGRVLGVELVEIAIDRRGHLIFDDLGQGRPGQWAIILVPFQAVRLHCLHDLKGHR